MDPYSILGVTADATTDEIHAAYRDLARQRHPDAGGTDPAVMVELNEAWHILSNPVRRAALDASRRPRTATPGHDGTVTDDEYVDAGIHSVTKLRLVVVTALVLMLAAAMAIVLIGFGRIGVG